MEYHTTGDEARYDTTKETAAHIRHDARRDHRWRKSWFVCNGITDETTQNNREQHQTFNTDIGNIR
ncbi:Uncharacterised protein [Vibrio cholerae]|nr:Uncharacterised protein [Vibrio cholerae]CSC46359.1 Uncharacterised protein [Vibrio cholerae]